MADLAAINIAKAEIVLEDAIARANKEDAYSPTVGVLLATDAIVRAVAALCLHYGVRPAKSDQKIDGKFLDLIRSGGLPGGASKHRGVITLVIGQRRRFWFGGELARRAEARKFARDAEGFVAFAAGHIREQGT